MKTNTGPSSRIREALRTIRGIAQEIVDAAADPSRKLSDLFTEAAIQRKVDACMGLALAVAACGRCKWLREVRREVEETAAVVIAADNALAPLMTLNPESMSHVQCAELKVFDMMRSASSKILVLAKLARMLRPYVIAYLHKEFVDIRIQLRQSGDAEGPLQTAFRRVKYLYVEPEPLVTSSDGFVKVMSIDEDPVPALDSFTVRGENVGYKSGDPDHGLMGAQATVAGKSLGWHCTVFDDEHAPEATFESDGSEDLPEPGEYTGTLTLNYAVDDGTGVSHLEPLVIENVKFKVSE